MILVTGSNGFIGQTLIPKLNNIFRPSKIIAQVITPRKLHEKKGLEILKILKVRVIFANLLNYRRLKKLPKKPEVVIHLAASVDTSESGFEANDLGTENLLKAIGPLTKKTHFIYISTAAVNAGRINCSRPIDELMVPKANNEYGRTKLRAENILTEYSNRTGMRLSILRLSTVYGHDLRKDKLFGMMQNYIQNNSIVSRINWPGKFGIIHVDDVVRIIVELIGMPPLPYHQKTYLASTENITLFEISKIMHKLLDKKHDPIYFPKFVWQIAKVLKYVSPVTERILPRKYYNFYWRGLIVLDDVLAVNPLNGNKVIPKWQRKNFFNFAHEVIIN